MTPTLGHIFRHPVKSIGYEETQTASLMQGRVLPFDRLWAISTEGRLPHPLTAWAPKSAFLRGAAAPELMAVTAQTHDDGRITFTHPALPPVTIDLGSEPDQATFVDWLRPLWPENRPAPRAVECPGVALTDSRDAFVSILSLSSLHDFAEYTGVEMSPHRFRGNLWVDGWPAWAERDMVGKTLRIGKALIEIIEPIGRCRATCANPVTGKEDFDTLAALKARNGDADFGLFGLVRQGGDIARNDPVEIVK